MAEVTVKDLAQTVGTPLERLLQQMQEAGLPQTSAEQRVSDEEKQKLLAFLKNAHGGDSAPSEPRKITLKRKTVSTLKVAGSKTVNVEVRKKKTYVKRDPAELGAERPLHQRLRPRRKYKLRRPLSHRPPTSPTIPRRKTRIASRPAPRKRKSAAANVPEAMQAKAATRRAPVATRMRPWPVVVAAVASSRRTRNVISTASRSRQDL